MIHFFNPYTVSIIFIFFTGACIGSFLNLAIYRIPIEISIITPRSHCPSCKKNIPFLGLIPILGFFLFRGKCFHCKIKISWQYPIVELISAILTLIIFTIYMDEFKFMSLFITHNFHIIQFIPLFIALWILYTGIILSAIDLKYRILPDLITIPGTLIGFIFSIFNPNIGYIKSLEGIAVGFLGLYILTKVYEAIRKQEGMGMGDVKYLGFIGSVVGPSGVIYTLFIASVIGSIIGIVYGLISRQGLKTSIPFGPFLAIGALIVFVFLC